MATDAPTTRDYSWKDMVVTHDPDHYEDDTAYVFTGNREFKSTDRSGSSIYDRD